MLEGYGAALAVARMMIDLGVGASGLTFPADHPKKWRRKKVFQGQLFGSLRVVSITGPR